MCPKAAGRAGQRPGSDRDALKMVSKAAIEALTRVDGTASGIKFNKLVYHIHKKLSLAADRRLRFSLPHRWYLYGAVVDLDTLYGYIVSRNPEEEMLGDFTWNAGRAALDGPEGLWEEASALAQEFAATYAGPEGIPAMLRAHYADAPLQFQRDYLEWSLLTEDMIRGRAMDSPPVAALYFHKLEATFPTEMEPRLSPLFARLALFLGPLIEDRGASELQVLRWQVDSVREFWRVFCLFLSSKYNAGLAPARLDHYEHRAVEELTAYKRRLSAFLTHEYAEAVPDEKHLNGRVGRSLAEALSASISGGDAL